VHLEARQLEPLGNEAVAEVVHVALHGTDHHHAARGAPALREVGIDQGDALLRDLATQDQLAEEVLPGLELLADPLETPDHPFLEQDEGVFAPFQGGRHGIGGGLVHLREEICDLPGAHGFPSRHEGIASCAPNGARRPLPPRSGLIVLETDARRPRS
jgi:hypothetical protein